MSGIAGAPRASAAPLALAVALLLATGCGDGDEATPGYRALALRAEPPYAASEAVRVAELAPDEASGLWSGAAPERVFFQEIFGATDTERVPALCLNGEDGKHASVRGDFDPRAFDHVSVRATSFGSVPEFARVECRRGGEVLATSEWQSFRSSKHPQWVHFALPALRRVEGRIDEIVVRLAGRTRTSCVSRIDLAQLPYHAFQPPGTGPGRSTALGEDARRAFGLSDGHALLVELEAPHGSELCFAYGSRPELRVSGEEARMTLVLTGSRGRRVEQSFALDTDLTGAGRWHAATADLAPFAGQRVEARFELAAGDVGPGGGAHEAFALVAEPAVRVRGRKGSRGEVVLLVTSDTHRADHMGTTADPPRVRTPHLDALAARGVLFEDSYSATNVTNPSHVSLMTALSPRDTRIVNNNTPLVEDAATLAEEFAGAGYRTFAVVSAGHLGHERSGLGQGFERLDAPGAAERGADATVDVLAGWLAETAGEPLFVWLHLFDVHAPYEPPAPFDRRYYPKDKDPFDASAPEPLPERLFPPFLAGLRDLAFPSEQYRAEVDWLDTQLGRALALPAFDGATVAFTADHGESFGAHGVWWDHAELYPDSVHVPLILSWPGGPRGRRVSLPVRNIDVGRTLLDLAGVEAPRFGGRDLRWALEDGASGDARFLLSAHGFSAAVQRGRWLLILHLVDHWQKAVETARAAHTVELYDLAADPGCTRDLVSGEHEVARELRAALIDWLGRASERGLGGESALTLEAAVNLEALGYTGTDGGPAGPWYVPDPEHPWCRRFAE